MTEQTEQRSWQNILNERIQATRAELRRRLVEAGVQFDTEPADGQTLAYGPFTLTTPDDILVNIHPGISLWGTRSNYWSKPKGTEPLYMRFNTRDGRQNFREKKTGWDWAAIVLWCVKYINDSIERERARRISRRKERGWGEVAKRLEDKLNLEQYRLRYNDNGMYVEIKPLMNSEAQAEEVLRLLIDRGWVRAPRSTFEECAKSVAHEAEYGPHDILREPGYRPALWAQQHTPDEPAQWFVGTGPASGGPNVPVEFNTSNSVKTALEEYVRQRLLRKKEAEGAEEK